MIPLCYYPYIHSTQKSSKTLPHYRPMGMTFKTELKRHFFNFEFKSLSSPMHCNVKRLSECFWDLDLHVTLIWPLTKYKTYLRVLSEVYKPHKSLEELRDDHELDNIYISVPDIKQEPSSPVQDPSEETQQQGGGWGRGGDGEEGRGDCLYEGRQGQRQTFKLDNRHQLRFATSVHSWDIEIIWSSSDSETGPGPLSRVRARASSPMTEVRSMRVTQQHQMMDASNINSVWKEQLDL